MATLERWPLARGRGKCYSGRDFCPQEGRPLVRVTTKRGSTVQWNLTLRPAGTKTQIEATDWLHTNLCYTVSEFRLPQKLGPLWPWLWAVLVPGVALVWWHLDQVVDTASCVYCVYIILCLFCLQDCLSPLSMQALPAAPEALCIIEMGSYDSKEEGGETGLTSGLFLNIGLQVCSLVLSQQYIGMCQFLCRTE